MNYKEQIYRLQLGLEGLHKALDRADPKAGELAYGLLKEMRELAIYAARQAPVPRENYEAFIGEVDRDK